MKKRFLILVMHLMVFCAFAQNPRDLNYNNYIVDKVSASDDSQRLHSSQDAKLVTNNKGLVARSTEKGGAFSYSMKVKDTTVPQLLIVQYDGGNVPEKGEQLLFNIYLNDVLLYTEGLNRNKRGLFEIVYTIPANVLADEGDATVRFQSYDRSSSVGQIYSVTIARDKDTFGLFEDDENWQGFSTVGQAFSANSTIIYTEPDGPKNPYKNNSVIDLLTFHALAADFEMDEDSVLVDVVVSEKRLKEDQIDELDPSDFSTRRTTLTLQKGKDGIARLVVPFSVFDSPRGSQSTLRKIKSMALRFDGKRNTRVKLRHATLLEGNSVKADAAIYAKAGNVGDTIVYPVTIKNTDGKEQTIQLSVPKYGWEAFATEVVPSEVSLRPGEAVTVELRVAVPEGIPDGGREKQVLEILPSANPMAVQQLTFTSSKEMPHPFTIHRREGWEEVRTKAEKYQWAIDRKEKYIREAKEWSVPERAPYLVNSDGIPFLCATTNEHGMMNNAIAWQLTRDVEYANKVKQFLLMISDYEKGFPLTRKASNQATVQEGHFFQHLAQAYDLIMDAGILTMEEREQIEYTFRLYIDLFLTYKSVGGANWAISQLTGVFFCALAMQDFNLVDEVLFAPSCLVDKFRTYTMPDGWWYECTVSYNLWVASQYMQIGLALDPFGYSLLTEKFPVDYNLTPEYDKVGPNEIADQRNIHHGHSFRIRGPIYKPYVTIKMMSDALLPFLDYRGKIFGINDATEREVGGESFEMAYFAFRDPRYAAFINMVDKRDNLIYGVAELPDVQPEEVRGAYADNAGVVMLRSTQKDPREKIQAVLKYGTHGGYHGHFDRTGLLSLMRYGRSFYNPEMVWYSYAPFMYNFYVQTSISKNMVTVDLKQQEADDSKRTLFHTGDLFQASSVEGTAKWSYPAYGGLRSSMSGPRNFKEKTEREARYFPIPDEHPEFGVLTGFTEPVFQRRTMVVTDDYVVLADYNTSTEDKQHRYDLMFQVKGLLGITADSSERRESRPYLGEDPLGAAPLVTDIHEYAVNGTVKASFLTKFGKGADNRGTRIDGEPGDLYMDIYNAWPNKPRSVFTGRAPEDHGTQRKLKYNVRGDGKTLASGEFGAWILGEGKVDVDLTGVRKLTLSTALEGRSKERTIFWGEAVLVTKDGKTLRLADLPSVKSNIDENPHGMTRDYGNGRINISGTDYSWGLPAESTTIGFDHAAEYEFDLSGLEAVRLKTVVGGDYPVGDESERRITFGVTTQDSHARYLSVIEPFEKESVIDTVYAPSVDKLIVKLKDGREHRFYIERMDEPHDTPVVKMQEWQDGKMLREDSTDID